MPGPVHPRLPALANRERMLAYPQALSMTSSGLVTPWDISYYLNATLLAVSSFTMPLPSGLYPGAGGMLTITQDGSGSRVITWASGYRGPSGTKPVLSTAANSPDEIAWYSPDGVHVDLSMQSAYS
jgi:hypothetical protein